MIPNPWDAGSARVLAGLARPRDEAVLARAGDAPHAFYLRLVDDLAS